MEHAWLDSLSEDWVSQPGSDTSAAQLPPLKNTDLTESTQPHERHSRIPRRSNGTKHLQSNPNDSSHVLSERSANENNISRRRLPSKLSQETNATDNMPSGRAVSAASNGSVVHNSVQHQQSSLRNETPEWKRRLVYGDVQYGEQRDLFCSAAAGLQDMFKPPTASQLPELDENAQYGLDETNMPSSPPIHPRRIISADLEDDLGFPLDEDEDVDYPEQLTPSPSPRRAQRETRFRPNDDDSLLASISEHRRQRVTAFESQNSNNIYQDESCLTASSTFDEASRKTSGQSDTRNEDFSPIMIGRRSDESGKIDFAPIELPMQQLKDKLERLRLNQMYLEPGMDLREELNTDADQIPTHIENTDDYMRQGGFINTRRGGRSGDGSFYNHGLSSELGADTSDMLAEESLQASTPKHFPSVRTEGTFRHTLPRPPLSPLLPQVPFPSPEKRPPRPDTSNSGGSPLKLFGPYDTFTNQTLLRRISQFEEGMSRSTSTQSADLEDQNLGQLRGGMSAFSQVQFAHEHLLQSEQLQPTQQEIHHFGAGELEGFEFSGDLSFSSDGHVPASTQDIETTSPPIVELHADSREPSPDREQDLRVHRRREKSDPSIFGRLGRSASAMNLSSRPACSPPTSPPVLGRPRRDSSVEGKRPRTSPSKDPTPKRRRTLHQSDIAFGREEDLALEASLQTSRAVLSKKRKDARPGRFELADPHVLAMRTILRPRSPTPSKVSSLQAQAEPANRSPSQAHSPSRPKRPVLRPTDLEQLPPPVEDQLEGTRKPSIRTQDFVDQAAQIMAMIRNQVRAPGLGSVEESELEIGCGSPMGAVENSAQESTNEPFSRPPSREGKSPTRMPPRQDNPEVVDRLKQYREVSGMADVLPSSMRSLGVGRGFDHENLKIPEQPGRLPLDGPLAVVGDLVSDLANVRISAHTAHGGSPGRDFPSVSSGQSTHGTYPSASSRGSDSRRTIMPESVSHLIPERVGSMYLDKQSNTWIKKKDVATSANENVSSSEDSEEDPFASIPDLSVDMTREMQNLVLTSKGTGTGSLDAHQDGFEKQHAPSRGYMTLSPDGQLSPRVAALTRGEFDKLDHLAGHTADDGSLEDNSDADLQSVSPSTRRRNLTISFSSPIASIIQDVVAEDLDSLEEDADSKIETQRSPSSPNRIPRPATSPKPALKNGGHGSLRSNSQALRQPSGLGSTFVPRPVSRIDEQDEDSTIEVTPEEDRQISIIGENSFAHHRTPGNHQVGLSFLFNHTPGSTAVAAHADDSRMISRNVGKLSLSPLSEFTINQSDQSFGLEVSYVMGQRHMATGDGSKRVMSMTIRELVDKLSEVEPFEPYWEDITELDLQDKRLTSLHMLDEFCGKVIRLDASKNTLGHLDGVPSCVRELKVSQNLLTELTSWDHLYNLQYVDVSGNELQSLSALKNLVHLRSVKADDNQLTSLDALDGHDGLLTLRARNNQIEEVDFAGIRLDRLTELDLTNNNLCRVANLELLPMLSRLRVPKNQLHELEVAETMPTLRQLDVSDNEFAALDVAKFPNLHTLAADRNYVSELSGFGKTRRLDSLSLREQQGSEPLDIGFLSSAYEVRKLFLSGNLLGSFAPGVDLLNLQLLELANCGLVSLPENLGQLMPNLRTLNLNMNGVSDLSALRFIPRLKKLLVAGNRLADSTTVTQLVMDFPHLTQVDLRDNPVTLGFYPPGQMIVAANSESCLDNFILPLADVERDESFSRRLDEATRLRRRLHQMILVASCKRLRLLDGLPMARKEILSRDSIAERLISEGLLPDPKDGVAGEAAPAAEELTRQESEASSTVAEAQQEDAAESSRWPAEDTFA